MFAGLSFEVLRRHARQQLALHPGWIITGLAGSVVLTIWLLARPYDIRESIHNFSTTVVCLIAWYALFTTVWTAFHWLKPPRTEQEPGLDAAPFSALQYFLHRSTGLCALPLLVLLLSMPLFLVMLIYTGDPYCSESQQMQSVLRPGWEWIYFPNPWGLRMFFVSLNLVAAVFIPLAVGLILQETIQWRPVRIIMQLAFPLVLWYVVYRAEHDFFRMCYRQTRGHDPWCYVVFGLMLLFTPLLLGWLRRRGRIVLAAHTLPVIIIIAMLPFLSNGQFEWVTPVRDLIGDARFAIAYYVGHLQPALNTELIMDRFQSSVLLDDHFAGNLIPRRVSVWVGAGLYPVLLPIWSFLMLGLGIAASKRHPTE